MYTDSCRSSQSGSFLAKFSNDTVLLTLLQGTQSDHGCALPVSIKWCEDNYLDLNISKTKELVTDFRKDMPELKPSIIQGQELQIVESYKYFGTIFDSHRKFSTNMESAVKRGQQRVHFLRRLNSCNVSRNILCTFYLYFIESLLTFSFICCFNGLSQKDKNSLHNIVKVCSPEENKPICQLILSLSH